MQQKKVLAESNFKWYFIHS